MLNTPSPFAAKMLSADVTPVRRDKARKLGLEALEPRLNLSGISGLAAPSSMFYVPEFTAPAAPSSAGIMTAAVQEVGAPTARSASLVESLQFGGSTVTVGVGTTTIPVDAFTGISNCMPEVQYGQTAANIGYVAWDGAYVEYTVSAANGGVYTLNFGLASRGGANLRVDVNGTFNGQVVQEATGSWTNYVQATALVQLPAGNSTIRFTAQNWTQYNLNNITLSLAGTPGAVTHVGDNTAIPVTAYSAINNSRLEYQNGLPDIGYVAKNGAYVDYTVNVASAGNYTLTAGAGSWDSASFDVFSNGTKLASFTSPASYSWQAGSSLSKSVYLGAGTQTLRFVATGGTQYNLFSVGLARQAATPAPASGYTSDGNTPGGVAVSSRWMTSFTELDVVGTAGNDTIFVSQSGGTIMINANGVVRQISGAVGEIAVWGGAGDDKINLDASVTIDARVYGGDGNDTLINYTRGHGTIVSYGGGVDSVGGNYVNTNYWVDKNDAVYAGSLEWTTGHVHVMNTFYQPGTTSQVTNAIDGANLTDPAANGGAWKRLSSSSFWGLSPKMDDINQGAVGDCYFLTSLQSLAHFQPDRLRTLAVDLGDGTFAVQFQRGGVTQYVRVDADLPTWAGDGSLVYNRPGGSGAQWASIMEKAYAYFRTGANSYHSLDFGWMVAVNSDFGIASTAYGLPVDQNAFFNTASTALAANRPVDVGTVGVITAGAPFVVRHTYSVVSVAKDAAGTVQVTLRNPWGMDGFAYDSNPWDATLTVPYSLLKANFSSGSILV